jgi:hypothetical protein
LARSASGVAYVIFFGAAFVSLAGGRTMDQWSVGALLLLVAASVIGWRLLGGPALELRHYPRGWRDVLAFRRPTVDLRRRVRSR